MTRTAEFIEEQKSLSTGSTSAKKRRMHPNSLANLKIAPFQPGVSGNPGGKPKYDVAAALARAVIEGCQASAYKGLAKALSKGNAYVFKELAERGYGKLKETKELIHRYEDEPDGNIQQRIDAILSELGLAKQVDSAGGVEGADRGAEAQAVAQEAVVVLPGDGTP